MFDKYKCIPNRFHNENHVSMDEKTLVPLLRTLVDRQQLLAVRYDANGKLTWVNDAYCAYCRMERDHLLGRNFIHRIPMEDLLRVSKAVMSLSPHHPSCAIQHEMLQYDGELRTHLWVHRATFDAESTTPTYAGVGYDITTVLNNFELLRNKARELDSHARELLTNHRNEAFVARGGVSSIA